MVAVVAAVLAGMAPSAGAQTRECFLLTQCTSVAGPRVVFGPLGPKPIPAGTSVVCQDSDRLQLPVGSDYELTGPGPAPSFLNVNVTRFMPGRGWPAHRQRRILLGHLAVGFVGGVAPARRLHPTAQQPSGAADRHG